MIAPPQAPEWVPHARRSPERAASLALALGAPLAVAHALVNRGVADLETARRFLDPALEDLHTFGVGSRTGSIAIRQSSLNCDACSVNCFR